MTRPASLWLTLRRVALVALSAFGLMVSPAWAESYYVDEGSIGGPCDDARTAAQARSAGTPWCSPARALGVAPEGATVVMRAGVYSNIRAVNIARSQMLTFKAALGEGVTLTGGADLEGRAIYMRGSRNLRFEGFKVTGGAYIRDSSFVELSGNEITTTGLRLRNVADALVEGNEFRDFFGGARALEATGNTGEPGVRRLTIRGNELHRIQHDAIALYWRLENVVVEDNYIHNVQRPAGSDLHPDAIQIAPQSEGAWGSVIVRRNRVIGCDQGLLVKDGTTRGLVVENNVIDNCEFFEAHIYNAPGAKFLNNTIDGRLYFRKGATAITALNNIVSTMPVDPEASIALGNFNIVDRSKYNPGYQPGPNDLDATATFVDVAGDDYRLAAGSIGIDNATSQGIPDHDLRGLARVDDPNTPNAGGGPVAYFDRGAYEHAAQAEAAPRDPTPRDPTPSEPAPSEPAPSEPTHSGPAPSDLKYSEPTHSESAPMEPAKLEVARSGVLPDRGALDVLAPITRRASGTVDVDFHAAGRHTRFAAKIDSQEGYVRFREDLPREQVRLGTGILTLTYPGNERTRGQEVRLRAASGRARLDLDRPTLRNGRLAARGTISQRARGVVRVQLSWATDGQDRSVELQARIRDGRWSLDEALPASVARDIARRDGTVHSYTLFTGYLPARMRGEMHAYQVRGAL